MTTPAIRVENLGKKFLISHQQRERYTALRDVLTNKAKGLGRRIIDLGRSPVSRPSSKEEFWALKDVSFEVQPGERIGIIGRNGAGKSTLLKLLSRITEPSAGRIELNGRVGSLLEVGTGFHPELTGRENIFLNGAILGMSKEEIRRRFDEIVAFADIEKFLDTPVKRYSSGMYVRLAFAVAAHLETEILLVDEVLAVGDAQFQKKCLGKMEEVSRGGKTIFFVSHNMAAVCQLCGAAFWLREGRLVQEGGGQSTVEAYLASATYQRPERVWDSLESSPGDDRVRLLSCRVLQNAKVAGIVDINEVTEIEMEFAVLKGARNLVSGINLYNSSGLCLFAHCDWRPNVLGPGRYTKRALIPANILAEGAHSVLTQLIFYEPSIPSVVVNDALSFEAIDGDSPASVRGPYRAGPWPGLLRPSLTWEDAKRTGPADASD